MKEVLLKHGVGVIVMVEETASSTEQNIRFSANLLKQRQIEKIVVFGDVVKKPKALIYARRYFSVDVAFYGINFWPNHRNTPF